MVSWFKGALQKYTLIITEKPDAANRIAAALDADGKPERLADHGVPYYQAHRNGDIVVVPALGHLYTVASKEKTKGIYPVFDYQWVARYQAERGASRIRVWLKVISALAENAEALGLRRVVRFSPWVIVHVTKPL